MSLTFGDHLSNALHAVKQHTGKKISIVQDEIGYSFEPALTGVTIESWRYRKRPPPLPDLELLAAALVSYKTAELDDDWLQTFLESGGHPYPEALGEKLFGKEESDSDREREPIHAEIAAPPGLEAYRPPATEGFVGRDRELKQYSKRLTRDGVAIIIGMAGVGKTTLAAHIAAEPPGREGAGTIFWHSFYDHSLLPFIRRLAGFLANHGRADLWEMLEAARSAGIKPPDQTTALDLLSAQMADLDLLICLDDLQFVDEEPDLTPFLQKLLAGKPQLLVTSRRQPSGLRLEESPPLGGLTPADTETLLQARALFLLPEQIAQLHAATEGHGAFLTLAAVALRHATDVVDLLNSLATVDNIERFLMEAVNDRLSANEQRVMEGVAVLCGYPGTRDVLEEMLNMRDVRRTLRTLADQHLVAISETEHGKAYGQHQIVQGFYYEQPRKAERRKLHGRAAEYYMEEEVDHFKATLHHARAGNSEIAAEVGTEHLWEIVNLGMARPLVSVLDLLPAERLDEQLRLALWLAQGQLDTLLGDLDNGREKLQQAAERLQELSTNRKTDQLKARVCLAMAELLERTEPPMALEWANRGISLSYAGMDDRELLNLNAALTIKGAALMKHMGNLGGAFESLETIRDQEASLTDDLKAQLWMNLCEAKVELGEHEQALTFISQALALSQRRRDHLRSSQIHSNMAYVYFLQGNCRAALNHLEEALGIANRLGAVLEALTLNTNLGKLYLDMGYLEEAQTHLDMAVSQGDSIGAIQAMIARINLSQLKIQQEAWDTASQLLEIVLADAEEKNDQTHIGAVYIYRAEMLLGQGEPHKARAEARRGMNHFNGLGDQTSLGIAERVLAEIENALGNRADALVLAEKSLSHLKGLDRFQFAQAELTAGALYMEDKDGKVRSKGEAFVESALKFYQDVGAKRVEKIDFSKKV